MSSDSLYDRDLDALLDAAREREAANQPPAPPSPGPGGTDYLIDAPVSFGMSPAPEPVPEPPAPAAVPEPLASPYVEQFPAAAENPPAENLAYSSPSPAAPAYVADPIILDPDGDLPVSPAEDEPGKDKAGSGISRRNTILISAVVLAAVAAIIAALVIIFTGDSPDKAPEAAPASDTVGAALADPGSTNAPTDSEARALTNKFSWYGDGISEYAQQFSPIIGQKGQTYTWNVSRNLTPSEAVNAITHSQDGIGDVVVFSFGTTDDVSSETLARLVQVIGPDRALVLVGVGASDPDALPYGESVNTRYQQLAATRPLTFYADWQREIDADPSLVTRGFIPDGRDGAISWTTLVNWKINEAFTAVRSAR